jgi:DNA-binding GntR family transcriptional regulator
MVGYQTMRELVAQALRQRVLSGELAPGVQIYQDKVARDLGVSRQPVREALRQLDVEGYIIIEPHRRVIVKELSREDVEELFVLRSAIEPFAAELAVKHITPATIERMRSELQRMEELQKIGASGNTFLVPDSEFHHALYEMASRQGLFQRIMGLEENSHRYIRTYIDLPGSTMKAIVTHRTILQAAEARDPQTIREAVIAHLQSTVSGILADLDRRALQSV